MSFVSRAKNGASDLHDARSILPVENHEVATLGKHPFKSVMETDHLPAELVRRAKDSPQDGVQPGTVATASQDTDPFFRH